VQRWEGLISIIRGSKKRYCPDAKVREMENEGEGAKAAVIVVDMVKGFCRPSTDDGPCALYVKESDDVIPRIADLIQRIDGTVIFTCDSHESDDKEFETYPPHCIKGTQESEIIEELTEVAGDFIRIDKSTYNSFQETQLEEVLRMRGITRVFICGLLTEVCVLAASLNAVTKGFETSVPSDCVTSFDRKKHQAALEIMYGSLGVKKK